jgi:hypothetical protein
MRSIGIISMVLGLAACSGQATSHSLDTPHGDVHPSSPAAGVSSSRLATPRPVGGGVGRLSTAPPLRGIAAWKTTPDTHVHPGTYDPSALPAECKSPPAQGDAAAQQQWEAKCNRDPADGPRYDANPMVQRVAWKMALSWWKHRPVLKFRQHPSQLAELVYAISSRGGTAGTDNASGSALQVVYQTNHWRTDNSSIYAVIADGGFALGMDYYPPGSTPPYLSGIWAADPVQVRGQTGFHQVLTRPQDNVNARYIRWAVGMPEGGQVLYTMLASPTRLSKQQLITLVDALSAA